MGKKTAIIPGWLVLVAILWVPFFGGCSTAYYGAMEKVGIHKRDIREKIRRHSDYSSLARLSKLKIPT